MSDVFCGPYTLSRVLIRGDRSGARPTLREAHDGGLFLFARTWPRKGGLRDLTGFWNLEVRTLLRLGGYPRADEFFVSLRDLGTTDDVYFVILDAGDRFPLSTLQADAARAAAVRNYRQPAGRRFLWRGMRKLATALGMLHAEGTLHRALGPESVFADTRGEGDFRLSGFEWSLRISGGSAPPNVATASSRLRAPELDRAGGSFSFATDWFDLGVLAAELLGFEIPKRGKRGLDRLRVQISTSSQLVAAERAVLLNLLEPAAELRLSQTAAVLQSLSEASTAVRNRAAAVDRPLFMGVLIGTTSPVSRALVEITKGRENLRLDDKAGQLAFMQRDLEAATHVLVRGGLEVRYIVSGAQVQYTVEKWTRGESTWQVGFCARTEVAIQEASDQLIPLEGRKIEPRAAPDLANNLRRAQQRCIAWDVALPPETRLETLDADQQRTLEFLTLTNQLDALLAAARIWPIRVASASDLVGRRELVVTPAPEEPRDALALALKLPECAVQMRDALFDDGPSQRTTPESDFDIADEGLLARTEGRSRGRWRFQRAFHHPGGIRYVFHSDEAGAAAPARGEKLYIMPRGLVGTLAQLKRRQRAIENLRQHAGLLSAIANPDAARRDLSDAPPESDLANGLDQSKRDAMRAMWGTQPLFTLQGPPGTGKTRLLTTCLLILLEADESHQVLVTAHSHEAINNVRRTLVKRIDEGLDFDPLVVRLDDEEDERHVAKVTGGLRDALRRSELATTLPAALQRKIEEEASLEPGAAPLRSFELLVRDAANVVLATSNSGELARMLEDQRRFDWSIIEEAGKAHGFDLALALQSSPKVLLIGDQDQLPPFNFEALQALFREPQRILEAVKLGARFAPSLVDRTFTNLSADERARFEENVPAWLDMVLFFSDLYRQCFASERAEVRLASRLTEQHRMHPVIACMVSECFYGRELVTHPDAEDRFATEPAPVAVRPGSWLPDKPMVFIDMPWVQEDKKALGEEGGPSKGLSYSNAWEADVVVDVLAELEPARNPCEIQLLSPYRAQVNLTSEKIGDAFASGRLAALENLEPPFAGKALGATVDEFQGSEADAVLISLVRNNDEKIGRGLGFLADRRRFNVLLSRARHRLVVVGSWRFLETRIDCGQEPDDDAELAHIARFIRWMRAAEKSGAIARVPYADVLKARSA